jgi:hypothetical protein
MIRCWLILCLCWLGVANHAHAQAPPNPAGEKEFADGQNWAITDPPLRWEIGQSGVWIIVPSGFVHDKASIPPALQSLIHKNGTYTRAAVIHDWLYWSQRCTRDQADNLLVIAMKESNVGRWDRRAVYQGVRFGGQGAWNKNAQGRARGELRFNGGILPEGNMTWPQMRAKLVALGRKDPPIEARSDYCRFGDSQVVPQ